jgi:hypothetical protein
MITIAEVIEQCAHFADAQRIDAIRNRDFAEATLCKEIANDIRDLAAKYEGCIVAEGEPGMLLRDDDNRCALMYRAKELETCKPALQVERGDNA